MLATDCRDGGKNVCRSCSIAVTAAIYRNGEEKPAIHWSFEMGIGCESDKKLFDFILRIGEGFGIADLCSQLKIARFKVTVSMKDFQVIAKSQFSI